MEFTKPVVFKCYEDSYTMEDLKVAQEVLEQVALSGLFQKQENGKRNGVGVFRECGEDKRTFYIYQTEKAIFIIL